MINDKLINKLIQCHIDHEDPETFVVGYLIAHDEEWFLMKDVSISGECNGFALYKKSDLYSVESSSRYIDKIAFLIDFKDTVWPELSILRGHLLPQIIDVCMKEKLVAGIELYASGLRDINGIIESFDDKILTIRQIDEYGIYDGMCWLDVAAITRVFFQDEESTNLKILFDHFCHKSAQ